MLTSRILKHILNNGPNTFMMPLGTRIIHVGLDRDDLICIWAWTPDHDSGTEDRTFEIFATGEDVPQMYHHHGSFRDEIYIWHIFEHNPLGRNLD